MFPAYQFYNGVPKRIVDEKKWPPMPALYEHALDTSVSHAEEL
jgi:hypothetical protein